MTSPLQHPNSSPFSLRWQHYPNSPPLPASSTSSALRPLNWQGNDPSSTPAHNLVHQISTPYSTSYRFAASSTPNNNDCRSLHLSAAARSLSPFSLNDSSSVDGNSTSFTQKIKSNPHVHVQLPPLATASPKFSSTFSSTTSVNNTFNKTMHSSFSLLSRAKRGGFTPPRPLKVPITSPLLIQPFLNPSPRNSISSPLESHHSTKNASITGSGGPLSPIKMNQKVLMESIARNQPISVQLRAFEELNEFTQHLMTISLWPVDIEGLALPLITRQGVTSRSPLTSRLSSNRTMDSSEIQTNGSEHYEEMKDEDIKMMRSNSAESTPRIDTFEDYGFLPTMPAVGTSTLLPATLSGIAAQQPLPSSAREDGRDVPPEFDETNRPDEENRRLDVEEDEVIRERAPEEDQDETQAIIQSMMKIILSAIDQKIENDEQIEKACEVIQRFGRGHQIRSLSMPAIVGSYAEKIMTHHHNQLVTSVCLTALTACLIAAAQMRSSKLIWLEMFIEGMFTFEIKERWQIEVGYVEELSQLVWNQAMEQQRIQTWLHNLAKLENDECLFRTDCVVEQTQIWEIFSIQNNLLLANVRLHVAMAELASKAALQRNEMRSQELSERQALTRLLRETSLEHLRNVQNEQKLTRLYSMESMSRQQVELTSF